MASDLASLAGYADVMEDFEDLMDGWSTESVWVVGTRAEYAIHVHEGTSKMEGRPFLTDAIEEVVRATGDTLADSSDDADDLLARLALKLEAETGHKITEYEAVESGYMRGTVAAIKVS